MRSLIAILAAVHVAFATSAFADSIDNAEFDVLKKQVAELSAAVKKLTGVIENQQKEIVRLSAQKPAPAVKEGAAPTGVLIGAPAASPDNLPISPAGNNSASKPSLGGTGYPFIPDIGLVGDIVATSTQQRDDLEGNDRLSLRELELVLGHDIDPYARFDATIAFSDSEDPAVEEAYVTYWGLPLDLKGKIGRMRPKVGKASSTHRDSLETVDEPLVVQDFFGGEGLYRTALELSGFTPISGDAFTQQLAAGVMEGGVGDGGKLFGETRRVPSLYAHLSNAIDLTDAANIELGGTYLTGSRDEDSALEVNAFGVDATASWFVTPRNKLKFQNEFYFQRRANSFSIDAEGNRATFRSQPWGFYSLLDFKLAERWGIGGRIDYVEPIDNVPGSARAAESAAAAYLTFFQSEFSRWRFQYERARLIDGKDDNRVFLQGTFAIGTHKHALQ